VLGEAPSASEIVGGAIVVAGVMLVLHQGGGAGREGLRRGSST
ncbi:MAG: hypothetical protein RI958_1249, partial [Actinomycetota bacterium]